MASAHNRYYNLDDHGRPEPIDVFAPRIYERAAGITDRVSLVNNRNPDPELFADIVDDLRALDAPAR